MSETYALIAVVYSFVQQAKQVAVVVRTKKALLKLRSRSNNKASDCSNGKVVKGTFLFIPLEELDQGYYIGLSCQENPVSSAAIPFAHRKMAFVSGPRQCGKTTLGKMLLEDRGASPQSLPLLDGHG